MLLLAATTLALALWRDEEQAQDPRSSSKARYTGWCCVSGPAELVNWLVDLAEDVDYETWARHVDLSTADHLVNWQIELLPTDDHVTFLRTRLPSGARAWVMQHGGIEHLYLEPGVAWDHQEEAELAEALVVYFEDLNEIDDRNLWDRTAAEVDQALRTLATPTTRELELGDWVNVHGPKGRRTGKVRHLTQTTFAVYLGDEFLGAFSRATGREWGGKRHRSQLRVEPLPKGIMQ